MPPPTTRVSAVFSRLAITASLSETLAPPSTTTYGRAGLLGQPLQHLDLGQDQAAGRVRQPLGQVVDAGLLAVHDPEAVGDEDVAEGGVLVGQRAALGLVLGLLARLVADVLQHGDVAVGQAGDGLLGRRPDHVGGQRDLGAEQLGRAAVAAGAREYFGLTSPLGRPRWASTTTLAPASRSWFSVGSDARIRPSSVIVLTVQRHVQVAADQHPLAAQVTEIRNRLHRGSFRA